LSRIHRLKEAARRSVGIEQGKGLAKMELQLLHTQYEFLQEQFTELRAKMDELLEEIPRRKQLLAMKGIGRDTAVGFLADRRYSAVPASQTDQQVGGLEPARDYVRQA
jgi:transposase